MKILHTADLHLGQIIYQNYDRKDEHAHFFDQLTKWCRQEKPDALLVSGDIFDIQQPSASVKKMFNDYFVQLHRDCPEMAIVITAGNHDSASRIQADNKIWTFANTTLIGMPPAETDKADWADSYIVRLTSGYIIAVPFMPSGRSQVLQQLLDRVKAENTDNKPVVMMAHAAVAGLDITGHDMQIGNLSTQQTDSFGTGWDYLALGHIHKPQTIGHQEDASKEHVAYPAPVVRYSGSALHVSCDEAYPHTISLVEIDHHGGTVDIQQLRIDELYHFYTLPEKGSFATAEEALAAIDDFKIQHPSGGYIRLRVDYGASLPSDFCQRVYDRISTTNVYRYNPKVIWTGENPADTKETAKPVFEVAELQQMGDPTDFVVRTIDQYPELDSEMVRNAFAEVREEMRRMAEEEANDKAAKEAAKEAKKAAKEAKKANDEAQTDNENETETNE